MLDTLTFVTSNENKVREAEAILGVKLDTAPVETEEIQSMDLATIAEYKAKEAYKTLSKPLFVEDAGLFIDAWGGFPGPFIKWLATTMGNDALAKAVPLHNRKATWVVVYGYFDGTQFHAFEGKVEGTLAEAPRGLGGWGFDPIFIPKGENQTYSELGEKKLAHSARQRGLEKFKAFLDEQD